MILEKQTVDLAGKSCTNPFEILHTSLRFLRCVLLFAK